MGVMLVHNFGLGGIFGVGVFYFEVATAVIYDVPYPLSLANFSSIAKVNLISSSVLSI